jgi:hypothetical protein
LTGGGGSDRYVFDTGAAFNLATIGIDRINGFDKSISSGFDKIVLDKTTFTALASVPGIGFSVAGEFATVANDALAGGTGAKIIYSATGHLFYDTNGNLPGFGTGGQFATISPIPGLAVSDFVIQA